MHIDINLIRRLLDNEHDTKIKKILKDSQIPDIAILIDQLSDKFKIKIYLLLPTQISSEVLLQISQHSRKFILKSLRNKYIVSLIEKAESDDSVDILGEVPKSKAKSILSELTKEKKEQIAPLIKYEEDTAGGLMQSELISLPSNTIVKEAINQAKKELIDLEGVVYIYVTDKKGILKGVVSITDIISSSTVKQLGQIMNKHVIKLRPDMDVEKVAKIFKDEDIMALPVVDKKGILLGRVTVDDVIDVLEEEATEDMFRIAGVDPDEHVYDPMRRSIKKRLPWLILNLVTTTLAALVIVLFRGTLESLVILAAFLPIIAGMGGNAGTQTLTLMIRGIALNQIHSKSFKKLLFKEMGVGVFNGFVTGVIMAVIVVLWLQKISVGIVIVSSMTITLLVSGFLGVSIPLLLKSMKVDPAIASSVFITTFVDVVGFFAFLGIAQLLLHYII